MSIIYSKYSLHAVFEILTKAAGRSRPQIISRVEGTYQTVEALHLRLRLAEQGFRSTH